MQRQQTEADPFDDDNKNQGYDLAAGGRFASQPSQNARRMGHPFCCGW